MTCIVSKEEEEEESEQERVGPAAFSLVVHCLYKEFSEMHFIIFTVYNSEKKNASPTIASLKKKKKRRINSRVHGVIANDK